jgi:DNA N6-methyl adenine demethylase
LQSLDSYVFCIHCNKIFSGWSVFNSCLDHTTLTGKPFSGVYVRENWLTNEEAAILVDGVDNDLGWDASQSGRRKRNNGPKVNFKKKKLGVGKFAGFPALTKFVRKRFADVDLLKDFITIEECYLEYELSRGAHIEPHIDDCWIWGERIVTVNCTGDSVLTLTKHAPMYPQQYNIDQVQEYKDQLISPLKDFISDDIVVRIPMPERSLLILYGSPRYQFEHSVLREDIKMRRVAIAYREFTVPYLENGQKHNEAVDIFKLCELT